MRYKAERLSGQRISGKRLVITVEVPQIDSLTEFIAFIGDEQKALRFINKKLSEVCTITARSYARLNPNATDKEIQQVARSFVPYKLESKRTKIAKLLEDSPHKKEILGLLKRK